MASLEGLGTPSTLLEFTGGTLSRDITAIYERLVAYSVKEALRTLEPRLRLLEQRISLLGAKLDLTHSIATDMASMASHPSIAHCDQHEHERQSLCNDSAGMNGWIDDPEWVHRVAGSHTGQHDGDECEHNLTANISGQHPQGSDTSVVSGTPVGGMSNEQLQDESDGTANDIGHTSVALVGCHAGQNECGTVSLDSLSSSSHDHASMVTMTSGKQEDVGTIAPAGIFTAATSSDGLRNSAGGKTRPTRNQRKKQAKASRQTEAHGDGLEHTPEHDLGACESEAKHDTAEDQNKPWHCTPYTPWLEIAAFHDEFPDIDSPR